MSSSSSGVRRCHHIKANGVRCGSPALRQHHYCFFHQRMRLRMAEAAAHASGDPREIDPERVCPAALDPGVLDVSYLPVLEDANSVQCALMIVLQRIFDGTLDRHRASLVLYGLQIASSNLKNVFLKTFKDDDVIAEIPKRTSTPPPPLPPDPQFSPDPRREAAREAYRARMAEIDRRYPNERRRKRPVPRPELPDFVRHPAGSPSHSERVATEQASNESRGDAVAAGIDVRAADRPDLASARRAVGDVLARELPKIAEAQPEMMRNVVSRTKIRRVPL